MTIFPSAASLLARQARFLISPPPTTLFESRAILFELQSRFGPISVFLSQRNDPVLQRILRLEPTAAVPSSRAPPHTILAVFDSPASRKSALDTNELTVSCGGQLEPSPKQLDPYNARGFHGRHHPPERNFTCRIVEEHDPSIYQRLAEKHPYSYSFLIDTLQVSHEDLLRSGVTLKGMADVMQTERTAAEQRRRTKDTKPTDPMQAGSEDGFPSNYHVQKDPQRRGGLMAAWKRGLGKDNPKEDVPYMRAHQSLIS